MINPLSNLKTVYNIGTKAASGTYKATKAMIPGVVGAGAFSQLPGFISHYVQRIGGHMSEAARNVADWQGIANRTTDGSLDQLINVYTSAVQPAVIEAGEKVANDVDRLEFLTNAYEAIKNSTVFTKPINFFSNLDHEIAKETMGDYVPNIPIDSEGAAYAALGLATGMLVWHGGKKLLSRK